VVVAGAALPRPTDGAETPAVVRGAVGGAERWPIVAPSGPDAIAVRPVLGLSSLPMVRDAARSGVGVARLPISLVAHDLAAGTLVRWGDAPGAGIALWALYPSRRLLSARVSAFLDHLREAFPTGAPEELAAYAVP
jgi:DNA-binding transcriptional LysR family regulator